MKREKNFYYFLVMIIYIVGVITSFLLSCRIVKIGNLTPTAAFIIYPLTYFLAILFAERYSKKEVKLLFHFSAFALIVMVLFITCSNFLPVLTGIDGLEPIFNVDYRIVFSYLTAFYVSQFINLETYYFVTGIKGFKFLISSVIAATIDSLIFVNLAYIGTFDFAMLAQKFTSQYVVNVFMVIVYTLLFTYTIDTVVETNNKVKVTKEEPKLEKVVVKEPVKKEVKKTTPRKTSSTKKEITKTTKKKPATKTVKKTTKKEA